MILKKFSWIKSIYTHIILGTFFGIFIFLGLEIFKILMVHDYQFTIGPFTNYFMNSLDHNFLTYISIVGIIYAYHFVEKAKNSESKTANLNVNLTNSKLKVLQAQIQPHFLFNGLNTISSLMNTNIQLAKSTTADLGDFLRDSLKIKDKNLIPVKEEIKLVNKYIDILRIRFEDQIYVNVQIDKYVENCLIPSMLLQPVIENSIKHGYSYDTNPLVIKINIIKKNNLIIISIKNNGKPIENNNYAGFGLSNLNERLQLLYSNNFKFSLQNLKNNKGVQTSIQFPCNPESTFE